MVDRKTTPGQTHRSAPTVHAFEPWGGKYDITEKF
jgi:hypothetical protein